jgi:response regulator RpfG family c-di-GMP phosphodiesterase
MSDSDLLFEDSDTPEQQTSEPSHPKRPNWRILIVDDEEQVHKVTSLVLSDCRFDQADVEIVHAHSRMQAQEILQNQPPFALALVDVVMETDDAGLRLVRYIREDLKDKDIRLVLRTGQPGQAPEETVIEKYDINDYKNKTELTSTKLRTLLYSALRSYRDIRTITANRQGLYNLIEATSKIVDTQQLPVFASAVLEEIGTLLNLEAEAVCTHTPVDAVAAKTFHQHYSILAATGKIRALLANSVNAELPREITQYFDQAKSDRSSIHNENVYIGYYNIQAAGENLLYVRPNAKLNKIGCHLLDIYTKCVAITHNNLHQKETIRQSRQELVYVLSETIERRLPDESNHVRRVSKMAYLLAHEAGLNDNTCERIKLAAPLHDIGTIGIPDHILTKQTFYTQSDKDIMAKHTGIGANILGKSERPVLKMASRIAAQHHEHWDGTGQPNKLKGEEIDLVARIVSIVDVIDALGCHKAYRPAFTQQEIIGFLQKGSAVQFDPNLVTLALKLMPEFKKIRLQYPDNN